MLLHSPWSWACEVQAKLWIQEIWDWYSHSQIEAIEHVLKSRKKTHPSSILILLKNPTWRTTVLSFILSARLSYPSAWSWCSTCVKAESCTCKANLKPWKLCPIANYKVTKYCASWYCPTSPSQIPLEWSFIAPWLSPVQQYLRLWVCQSKRRVITVEQHTI